MLELGKKMRKKWNLHELDTQRMVYKDLYFKNNNSILLLWKAMLFSQKTIINLSYYGQLLQYKLRTLCCFNLILERLLSLSYNWSKLLFCWDCHFAQSLLLRCVFCLSVSVWEELKLKYTHLPFLSPTPCV